MEQKYVFNNMSPMQEKINYSIAAAGSLAVIYGFTASVAICNVTALLGGALILRHIDNDTYTLKKSIKNNLRKLIKDNALYVEEDNKITYRPEVYFGFDESFIEIKIRIDGSKYRGVYLDLDNNLQDLFVMECVSKELIDGCMIYRLDRTSTERLSMSNIKGLQEDLIPINSKMSWNYRKCPHALFAGVTGKGKTYFLAYLIKVLTLLKAEIKIIDPKMSDLSYLERIYKESVVSSPGQIAQMLRETKDMMNQRYETFKHMHNYGFGKDFKDYGFRPVFILFDEMAAFMATADRKTANEIEGHMLEIIMKGRQAGVFMILTTQRPDSDVIKTAIRDQLGLRVALGEMSKTGYTMVFGSEFKDLELNNSAPGNGFIFIDGIHTKPVKFQSPLFESNYNLVKDLANLTRRG